MLIQSFDWWPFQSISLICKPCFMHLPAYFLCTILGRLNPPPPLHFRIAFSSFFWLRWFSRVFFLHTWLWVLPFSFIFPFLVKFTYKYLYVFILISIFVILARFWYWFFLWWYTSVYSMIKITFLSDLPEYFHNHFTIAVFFMVYYSSRLVSIYDMTLGLNCLLWPIF